MTANEYRAILQRLSQEKRKELNEHIYLGNQPDVESMVLVFEKYPEKVERQAVFWINKNIPQKDLKIEADRVGEANMLSALYGRKSYYLSFAAMVISIISLVVSIIAIWK
jgi:hypothetical protein